MQVDITSTPRLTKIDHLFLLAGERGGAGSLPASIREIATGAWDDAGFQGRADEGITILRKGGPKKVTLIGLGKDEAVTLRVLRAAIYGLSKIARRNRDANIAVAFGVDVPSMESARALRLLATLLAQSDYRYDAYITVRETEKPPAIRCTLIAGDGVEPRAIKTAAKQAAILHAATTTVKDLGNGPGNEVTPERLGQRAMEVSKEAGIKCSVFDLRQIQKMKMGGLLAVNRGSALEPRFVVMDYAPKGAKRTVCVVGKGITFDSGGISIKPAERMEEMKFDMSGAAAVIGTMQAAAGLELKHRVIGIFAATENLPSGSAYKPGDIIRMMSGKTVEIVNTDAEGRMVLADALHYASMQKPDHIIDFATLTGACVVALGNEASGLFTPSDELARKLIEAGERAGERLWRLPEWNEYKDHIRSEWADVKNSGGRWAGATTAAVFLKEFADCPSWAHIDIAGTAWMEGETPREVRGATGLGVRLMIEFLENLS